MLIIMQGRDSFNVVDAKSAWYLDLTGSGNETYAHMIEPGNARLTVMFHAFEGPPNILRLYAKGP